MKKCRNCGNEMKDDELFCCECGTKSEIGIMFQPEPENDEEAIAADIEKALDAAAEEEKYAAAEEEYVTAKLGDPIFCPECGMENEADGIFCQNCGAALNEAGTAAVNEPKAERIAEPTPAEEIPVPNQEQAAKIYCPACGTPNDSADAFCQNCGANLREEAPMSQQIPAPVKKKSKLPLIIGGIAAVAVVIGAAAFGMSRLGGGSEEVPYVRYLKDTGLYQYNVKSKKGMELSSKALKKNSSNYSSYAVLNQTAVSKDGKYTFFYEGYDGESGKLCYINQKKQSDKNDTTEKIDTDVSDFQVTDDNKVIYKKGSNNTVYIYDLKHDEKEKVGTGIYNYSLSEDGSKLLYFTSDQDLYYRETKADADKEKLDSDVEYSYYYTKDLNTIYYTKDTGIYCIKNLKDKEKIASDAFILDSYNDNAGIYYSEYVDPVLTLEDILEDDMAAADLAMQEPVKSNYTRQEQSIFGGSRTVTDYDAYNAAMEEYREKEKRDVIRSNIKTEEAYYLDDCNNIYAYDGTEHELVKNAVYPTDIGYYDWVFYTYSWDDVEFPTIKISEVESVSDIVDFAGEAYASMGEEGVDAYLISEGKAIPFTYESDMTYTVDQDSKILFASNYVYDETTSTGTYEELVSMKFSDAGLEKPVTIDDDLGEHYSSWNPCGGKMYYYKDYDYEKNQGTLYCDGKEIDDDVHVIYYDEDSKEIFYLKELSKSHSGTLCRYDGNKPVVLADDVTYFAVVDDQYVAVLVDYSSKRQKGELKLISRKDGKKTKTVDEDVSQILGGVGSYKLNN